MKHYLTTGCRRFQARRGRGIVGFVELQICCLDATRDGVAVATVDDLGTSQREHPGRFANDSRKVMNSTWVCCLKQPSLVLVPQATSGATPPRSA